MQYQSVCESRWFGWLWSHRHSLFVASCIRTRSRKHVRQRIIEHGQPHFE
jgi:hypothetical protein